MWSAAKRHPNAPPFSGGVLDAWPSRLADAFAVLDFELELVRGHVTRVKAKEQSGG